MPKCTIHLNDEVNVKFEGLDLDIRKRLTNQFKKEIPHARYMPAVRLGRWDGKKAFFNLGGTTYLHLLDQILPIIDQAGYDIELNDQRDYTTHFEFEPVTETTFQNSVWPAGHPAQGQPIVLREHQVSVINEFLNHPQSLQEVATGAGKCLDFNTQVPIEFDENSDFGQFLLNKLRQEPENDTTANHGKISGEKLAENI